MAALLFLAPLLLLGTVAGQEQAQTAACPRVGNATEGNFSVKSEPQTYWASTTYEVSIKDDRNHSDSTGRYLLQALSPQNTSVGDWLGAHTENCSSITTAMLNLTKKAASWKSPPGNLSSVQIRVYLSLANTTELKIFTLSKGAETPPTTTSPNSVSRARSSSLLPAALLLLTGTLLS